MNLLEILIAATVASGAAQSDVITLKDAEVMVVDLDDRPLFRSSRDYLLKMTNNPSGKVMRYDPVTRRVLVSSAGPEFWIRCAELMPMVTSCPAIPAKPATRSIRIPRKAGPADEALNARGLPACPGDPRCPKSD